MNCPLSGMVKRGTPKKTVFMKKRPVVPAPLESANRGRGFVRSFVSAGESRSSSSFARLVEAPGSQQRRESISGRAGAELVVRGDSPGERVFQQLPVGREPSRGRKGSQPLQLSRSGVLSTCGGQSSSVSSSPPPGKDTFSPYTRTHSLNYVQEHFPVGLPVHPVQHRVSPNPPPAPPSAHGACPQRTPAIFPPEGLRLDGSLKRPHLSDPTGS